MIKGFDIIKACKGTVYLIMIHFIIFFMNIRLTGSADFVKKILVPKILKRNFYGGLSK